MNGNEEKAAAWIPASFAGLLLLGFHVLVLQRMGNDPTSLGYHAVELSPGFGRFLGAYLFFGLAATVALLLALHRGLLPARWGAALRAQIEEGSDRTFVVAISLLALALGSLAYRFLLLESPITDDEGAYRFAAQILAKGKLYLPSDPDKDFFDHVFLINNGRFYSQYFLGWPALLVPALLLHLEGYANAFYFALAMPAIYGSLELLCDTFWARLGALLTLSSPMLFISAGTLLSHTSCMAALAWCLYAALRCRAPSSSWRWHSAFFALFCLAFFIRPLTAVGMAAPLLVCWLWDLKERHDRGRVVLAAALPALLAAGLFLGINAAMNGHPFKTAYDSYLHYRIQGREPFLEERELGWVSFSDALSLAAAAFHRLGFASLGWPFSWLFVFFAGAAPGRSRILAMVPSYFAAHLPVVNVGIDTYAPMHYVELALPMVLLTALGLERTTRWASEIDQALLEARGRSYGWGALPLQTAVISGLIALVGLLPYELDAVRKTALLERITHNAIRELPRPVVLFALQPYYTKSCFPSELKNWVHQWPINPPDLDSEVIWLAHVSLERDRELMARRFPDRQAFLVTWQPNACERRFVPLSEASEREFPPINQRVKI